MKIKLNNRDITTSATTLADLLEEQSIETKGVAVAINRSVVPRSAWGERAIEAEDSVVVVSAVYGG